MTEAEAIETMSRFVILTNGWDEPKFAVWVEKLMTLNDIEAARTAFDTVADTWTELATPPWALFLENYMSSRRRAQQPSLPPPVDRHTEAIHRFIVGVQKLLNDAPGHNHRNGVDNCPTCSMHTHQHGGPCARCDQYTTAANHLRR